MTTTAIPISFIILICDDGIMQISIIEESFSYFEFSTRERLVIWLSDRVRDKVPLVLIAGFSSGSLLVLNKCPLQSCYK